MCRPYGKPEWGGSGGGGAALYLPFLSSEGEGKEVGLCGEDKVIQRQDEVLVLGKEQEEVLEHLCQYKGIHSSREGQTNSKSAQTHLSRKLTSLQTTYICSRSMNHYCQQMRSDERQ